jgi:hypothetical protein
MATRRNGGIKGVQNRTTGSVAAGAWSMDDIQQSSVAHNWPGAPAAQVPNPPSFATAAQFTAYISGSVMTVTAVSSGTLAVGQLITGAGVTQYTTIDSLGTGTGSTGTYNVGISQTVGSSGSPVSMQATISFASTTSSTTSVKVPFTTGYDGGSPITGVTATVYSGSTAVGTATGTSSPLTVTSVPNSSPDSVSLYATNAIGNSTVSTGPYFQTPSVPSAPTIGTATLSGSTVNVAFTASSNSNGSPITSYTATSTPGGITATGTTSPINVSGLSASTSYTFTVHANNTVGSSAESAASNSVTTPVAVFADYLVVAGGAGGAGTRGGGGGAGGLLSGTGISVSPGTTYSITVGSGGLGGAQVADGANGSNSVFSTYTATGGGGGGTYSDNGLSGGSGGGGGANHTGGAGTSGQGYAGGAGETPPVSYYTAGGGGGAGQAGAAGTDLTSGGVGGNGLTTTIITTTVATSRSVGQVSGGNVYFAGGGGGGSFKPATTAGGLGGGGIGGIDNTQPSPSPANTGGGGGGGGVATGNGAYGGNGGSGCVIIALTQAAASTTGSPTLDVISGKYVYIFKGNGSITP